MNLCETNQEFNNRNQTNEGKQNTLNSQQQQQQALNIPNNKEYSLCALFSILYPFDSNFNQSTTVGNGFKVDENVTICPFVPEPPKEQILWSDFEVESISDFSSQSGSSDIAMTSDIDDDDDNTKNQNNSKQLKSNHNTNNKISKSKKRIFVGGIKFDDLGENDTLKKIRVEKLINLFTSCGKIESIEPHWNKGFCFITYQQCGIAQRTVKQFENSAKKHKLIDNIKKTLCIDTKIAAPTNSIYVRIANPTCNSSNKASNKNKTK